MPVSNSQIVVQSMNYFAMLLTALVLPALSVTAFAQEQVAVKTLLEKKVFKGSDGMQLKYLEVTQLP